MSMCDSMEVSLVEMSLPPLTSQRVNFQNVQPVSFWEVEQTKEGEDGSVSVWICPWFKGRMLKLTALSSLTWLFCPLPPFSRKSSREGRLKVAPPPPTPPQLVPLQNWDAAQREFSSRSESKRPSGADGNDAADASSLTDLERTWICFYFPPSFHIELPSWL